MTNQPMTAPQPEQPMAGQTFYVTFGTEYPAKKHPSYGKADGDGWVRIIAPDYETARALVVGRLSRYWSAIYDDDGWDPSYFRAGEIEVWELTISAGAS